MTEITATIDNAAEPVLARYTNGPTSLVIYWKLDPWNQGYVVALEAGFDASEVRGQRNPYQARSHDCEQWGIGHHSGDMAGLE